MNKKLIFTGIISFALGGATGFFVCDKMLKKEYETIADELIEEARQEYVKRYEAVVASYEGGEVVEDADLPADIVFTPEDSGDAEIVDFVPRHANVVPDSNETIVQQELEENSSIEVPYDLSKEGAPEEVPDALEITMMSYHEDYKEYEKEVLWYYSVDEVLADANDSIVDGDELCGFDSMTNDAWRGESNRWFRCFEAETDFEVIRVDRSHAEQVHEGE